jgi:putative membrane protein
MVVGILAMGGAVDFLLGNFSMQTGGFIGGLMAGSLPFLYGECNAQRKEKKFILFAVVAAASIIIVSLLAPDTDRSAVDVFDGGMDIGMIVLVFVGGAVAAAALVIPGISGAMVLMLFGLFPIAMHTISNIREYLMSPTNFELLGVIMAVVVPLGIGMVVGILLGSKVIAWLLEKFHSQTYYVILGLVFGTIFVIFSDPATYQSHAEITPLLIAATAITFACGAVTSLFLGKRKD